MEIEYITNSFFNSRTYILSFKDSVDTFIVDCGDAQPIIEKLHGKQLVGIFLTHGHFDHIYGLNQVVEKFPDCNVYCSEYTREELKSPKLNYSRYHDDVFEYLGNNIVIINDGDIVNLTGVAKVEIIATPGHDKGELSYKIGNALFTGDAYIPGIKTVTHLRGDKEQAKQSEILINQLVKEQNLTIYPGH